MTNHEPGPLHFALPGHLSFYLVCSLFYLIILILLSQIILLISCYVQQSFCLLEGYILLEQQQTKQPHTDYLLLQAFSTAIISQKMLGESDSRKTLCHMMGPRAETPRVHDGPRWTADGGIFSHRERLCCLHA